MVYLNAKKYELALDASKMSIELDPNTFPGYRTLGLSLFKLEKYDEAIEAYKKAALFSSRHPWILVELSSVYALSGKLQEAKEIMEELKTLSQSRFVSGMFVAAYHLREYDKSIEYLELAITQRDGSLISMKNWPLTEFVETDLRFQPYLKRFNYPE